MALMAEQLQVHRQEPAPLKHLDVGKAAMFAIVELDVRLAPHYRPEAGDQEHSEFVHFRIRKHSRFQP